MTILICRHAEVVEHWRDTVSSLRGVLPESGGIYLPKVDTSGFSVELTVGGKEPEMTPRYTGIPTPVVPFLDVAAGQDHFYWLAWHESWRTPQSGAGKNRKQFGASSITVYAGAPGNTKQQVLRAEWAGAAVEVVRGRNTNQFQGNGAAHPHWHIAGVGDTDRIMSQSASQFEQVEPARLGLAAFGEMHEDDGPIHDRTALLDAALPNPELIAPAWARIHLAASARWAQEEWSGPGGPHTTHAFNPVSCGEIRSWIVSCVRYLQSELQGQVGRGRM